jgi:hypothetical protein
MLKELRSLIQRTRIIPLAIGDGRFELLQLAFWVEARAYSFASSG